MAVSPIPVLAIVLSTLVFQGLLYGSELAQASFPTFSQPSSGGFFGALEALLAVVQAVWGVVVFFFNLITFNVPGAPWFVRTIVGSILSGALVWSIAQLIRGN